MVAGHTGFKGSWLSIWLHELGANVIGFALDPNSPKDNFVLSGIGSKITDVRGDIRDGKIVKDIFNKYQPEIVFHLAAIRRWRRRISPSLVTSPSPASGLSRGYKGPLGVVRVIVLEDVFDAVGAIDQEPRGDESHRDHVALARPRREEPERIATKLREIAIGQPTRARVTRRHRPARRQGARSARSVERRPARSRPRPAARARPCLGRAPRRRGRSRSTKAPGRGRHAADGPRIRVDPNGHSGELLQYVPRDPLVPEDREGVGHPAREERRALEAIVMGSMMKSEQMAYTKNIHNDTWPNSATWGAFQTAEVPRRGHQRQSNRNAHASRA